MGLSTKDKKYDELLKDVGVLLEDAQKNFYYEVNQILVKTYWEIGRRIVELEQGGAEKAESGEQLLNRLAKDLEVKYGRGFSRSNIYLMHLLYLKYDKIQTLSGKLSWSDYAESFFLQNSATLSRKLDFNRNIYKLRLFTFGEHMFT